MGTTNYELSPDDGRGITRTSLTVLGVVFFRVSGVHVTPNRALWEELVVLGCRASFIAPSKDGVYALLENSVFRGVVIAGNTKIKHDTSY